MERKSCRFVLAAHAIGRFALSRRGPAAYNAESFLLPDGLVWNSGVGIAVVCQGCQAQLNVRDDMAGAKGKCPKCGASLRIPAVGNDGKSAVSPPSSNGTTGRGSEPLIAIRPPAGSPAGGASPAETRAAVASAFSGHVAPVDVSSGYRSAVSLVACCFAALVVAYYAFVACALAAVLWYTVAGAGLLSEGSAAQASIYVVTVVLGLLAALLLAKTVVAPAPKAGQGAQVVDPTREPLLVEFVERIAKEVGAIAPSRIWLNCDIYVSAHPPKGWGSPFGRELELTLGLPLLAGISLQEFGGSLAHEMALFTGASGKRRAYIIRTASEWFQRIAMERDAWDIALFRASRRFGSFGEALLAPLRGCIWLTRRPAWCFMVVAHALAGYLMREMERNADRYQTRVSGAAAFESLCKRRILLQYALRGTQSDLEMLRSGGSLPDNLPRFVVATAAQQPAEVQQTLLELIDRFQTGPIDPRLSDKERIAAARGEQTPFVLHSDLPASALFADFEASSRTATLAYYAALFGNQFNPSALLPVEQLIDCRTMQEQAAEARKRFFHDAFGLLRPIRLPSPTLSPPSSVQLVQAQLQYQREQMRSLAAAYAADYALYAEADNQYVEASRAVALLKAGLAPRADLFSISFVSLHQASDVRKSCGETLARLASRMESFEWAAGQRIHAALTLLQSPEVAAKVADAKLKRQECERLLGVVSSLAGNWEDICRLRTDHARLTGIVEHARGSSPGPTVLQELQRRAGRVFRELQHLHRLLDHLDYPFPDEHRGTVARALLPTLPPPGSLQAVISRSQEFLDNLISLYGRCLDQLCVSAEAVEATLSPSATVATTAGQNPPA